MRSASVLVAVSICSTGLVVLAQSSQTPPASPQTPQTPVFRSSVDLVPLTVTVLDRRGRPVTDLSAGDFTVFENDRRREIVTFFTQAMDGKGVAAAAPATGGIVPAQRRLFLLVLGFGRIQFPGRGVDGALSFVRDRLLPSDAVSVMAFHRTTTFTTDHRAVVGVLERYKHHHERIVWEINEYFRRTRSPFSRGGPPLPQAMLSQIEADIFGSGTATPGTPSATLTLRNTADLLLSLDRALLVVDKPWQRQRSFAELVEAYDRSGWTLSDAVVMSSRLKLLAGIEHVRDLDGDRHVVVIAETGIPATADAAGMLARRAAAARVAVDYIWTRGTNRFGGSGCASCRDLAELTGGHYTSVDYADQALARIDQATRFSYLLGYAPLNTTLDANYRNVRVTVNRRGVVVQFAHGYYATPEAEAAEVREAIRQTRMEAALALPTPVTEIPVAVAVVPASGSAAPGMLRVEVALDASTLALQLIDGRRTGQLELQVHCADARETIIGSLMQRLDLNAAPETYAEWLQDRFRHVVEVPIKGVPGFVKAVVYDFGGDRVGSRVLTIGRD